MNFRLHLSFLILLFLVPSGRVTIISAREQTASTKKGAKVTGTEPKNFQQLSESAERARQENRDDEAILLYRQALKIRPDWEEGLWYLGATLYQKELFAESRDVMRQFVAESAQSAPGWAILGLGEFKTREYSRALDHMQRALSLGLSDRPELVKSVYYFVCLLRTRFEQYDDSASLMMSLVRAGKETDLYVEPLGLAALRLPLLPSEISADRRELISIAGKGTLALEARQAAEVERLYSTMAAAYPDEPGVHFLYGTFLMDLRPAEGIREMRREIEISPSHLGARLRLAEEYLREQELDLALPLAEEVIRIQPGNALGHMLLGEVLVAKGDLAKGIAELETARRASPGRVRTHWDLLRAYSSAGRTEDARREKDEIEKLGSAETSP